MPTLRATSAPRSQRSAVSSRAPSEPCAISALMCRAFVSGDVPGAVLRSMWRSDCPGRRWSVVLRSRLTSASACPYSDATLAALDEQPASFSSRA